MNKKSVKSSLRYSVVEGSLWALMYGLGENFLSALSVFLGYSALQISILNSFPQLIGSFLQLLSNNLLKIVRSTKKFVVYLAFIQSILWICLIYILIYNPKFYYLLCWFIIYFLCNSLIGPVWTSWMGFLVPRRIRGKYYGSRNRIINSFILASILLGGLILKIFADDPLSGFLILFSVASIGRFLSTYYLQKKDEIKNFEHESNNGFQYFLNQKHTRMFIIFKSSINFAVMFLGPLFTIYILRTLKLGNFILSLCMVSWWIANVLASKYWGDYSKENGNLEILKINTLVLSLLPILWIASYYLHGTLQIVFILIINLFAGITFSGFSLASFNLVYELVEKDDVVKYSSLLYLGEGTSIFLGSIMAGSIVDSIYINNIVSNVNFTSIQLSMLISTLLRCICVLYFFKFQKELNKFFLNKINE